MTIPSLTCETFADTLADFLEHDVDDATIGRMELHARSCAECGPLLADVRALRHSAAALPELVPSRDLWSGIEARIETPIVELNRPKSGRGQRTPSRRLAPLWYGLAAAGLVAVTATVTHELTRRSMNTAAPNATSTVAQNPAPATHPDTTQPPRTLAARPDSAPSQSPSSRRSGTASAPAEMQLAAARPTAEQTYDSEIARLRKVVNQRRGQLDSTTVATIEKNLAVIDLAIAQCQQALRKDPASRFLIESLNDAMDTKVQLLRTAASLPSAM